MIKDSLVVSIAELANQAGEDIQLEVTIALSGFLVSGDVISAEEYCDSHPVSRTFHENVPVLAESEEGSDDVSAAQDGAEPPKISAGLLHLGNAQFFSGSGAPIPRIGTKVRIPIHHIQSFSFGRLAAEK